MQKIVKYYQRNTFNQRRVLAQMQARSEVNNSQESSNESAEYKPGFFMGVLLPIVIAYFVLDWVLKNVK